MLRKRNAVGARELKTRLGGYLRRVRQGTTLVVTDRGEPVAELRPLPGGGARDEAALASLESSGAVTRARKGALPAFRAIRGRGTSAATAISEGREDRF